MLLDARGVRGAEDAEELVVRDEEEAGEGAALCVEVLREGLLTGLELLIKGLQGREPSIKGAGVEDVCVLGSISHDLVPLLVDRVETLGLLRQLMADVIRSDKDRLEVPEFKNDRSQPSEEVT